MDKEPIIIVGGEPNSVFLEIFFKSLKTNVYKSPLIIIASKRLLQDQMKNLDTTIDIENEFKKAINFERNRQLNQYSKIYYNKIKKNLDFNE